MRQIPEHILIEALRMYDEGKPAQEILARFSSARVELEKMFSVISVLEQTKGKVLPSEKLLGTILEKWGTRPVTVTESNRYVKWSWLKVAVPLVSATFVLLLFLSTPARLPNSPVVVNDAGIPQQKMMLRSAPAEGGQAGTESAVAPASEDSVDGPINEIESSPIEDGSESDEAIYSYVEDPSMNEFDSVASDSGV